LRFFSAAAWGPTAVQDFTCDEWPLFKIQNGIEIDRFCHNRSQSIIDRVMAG